MVQKLCGIMVRTLARLVDYHVYIRKPSVATKVDFPSICVQELQGDHRIVTALSGELDGSMIDTAIGFAGSENVVCEEDCLDALCELINCVNGLLATEMSSKSIDIDMDAPFSQGTPGSIESEAILSLPVVIYGKELVLDVILDKDYTI